jgi:ABC-2 type transport system ATP-binding protein
MWGVIQELVGSGATLLLTTQYLEEADVLADDIVVIDRGRAIARGTADQLKAQTGGERVEVVVADPADRDAAARVLAGVAVGEVQVDANGRGLSVAVNDGVGALGRVLQGLQDQALTVVDVGLRRPTLDDVFLTLTGHAAETDGTPSDEKEEASA